MQSKRMYQYLMKRKIFLMIFAINQLQEKDALLLAPLSISKMIGILSIECQREPQKKCHNAWQLKVRLREYALTESELLFSILLFLEISHARYQKRVTVLHVLLRLQDFR